MSATSGLRSGFFVALLGFAVLAPAAWAAPAVDPATLMPREEGIYLEVDLGEDNARVPFLRSLIERVLDAAVEGMGEENVEPARALADQVREHVDWVADGFGPKAAVLITATSFDRMFEMRTGAMAGARERAKATNCASNLKQLSVAAMQYTADHDGVLPRAEAWVQELQPYVGAGPVFRCLKAPDLPVAYAMSRALSGRRLADIDDPAGTVLFFESDLGGDNPAGGVADIAPLRHPEGNNFAFVDGHVSVEAPPREFPILGRWEAPPPAVEIPPAPDGDEVEMVPTALAAVLAPEFIAVINTRYELQELLDKFGAPTEEPAETYRGVAVYSGEAAEGMSMAVTQGCVLFGNTANVKAALDVAAGEGEALADDPVLRRAIALLPEPRMITYYLPMDLAIRLLTRDMANAPEGMGPPEELRKIVETVIEKYEPIEAATVGIDLSPEGLLLNEVVTIKPGVASEFLDRIAEIPPATERGANLLPQGTLLSLALGGFGDWARLGIGIARELAPEGGADIARGKDMVKQFIGLDVDTELLPLLSQDILIAVTSIGGRPLPVQGVLMIQGPDADTVRQRVATVRETLAAQKVKFLDGETAGSRYGAVMIPDTPVAIAFAQVDDVLIIASSVETLEACLLTAGPAPAVPLTAADPYRTQRAALPETAISLVYLDLGGVAEKGVPMLKRMGAPIPDLEVPWNALGTLMGADYRQQDVWRSTVRWNLNPDIVVALAARAAAPAFEDARERAAAQACLHNLEQLAVAALRYADEHDGVLPRADTWVQELEPYLESADVLKCGQAPDLAIAYAMNRALSGDSLADIRDPANTPLFFESELRGPSPAGRLADIAPPRHWGGNHFAFVDGHVALMTPPHEFPTLGNWEVPEFPPDEGEGPEVDVW